MKKQLNIQQFIEQHSDWEKLLSEKPYCLSITRDVVCGQNLVMFKYSQIDSDMSLPLVKECRGIILNEDTLDVVSCGFFKFFNYGEPTGDTIDWSSCYCTEKLDGSLIKVVRIGNMLLVSTNGTIDAYKAPIVEQIGCEAKNFGELFVEGVVNAVYDRIDWDGFGLPLFHDTVETTCLEFFKSNLEENKTYMFELTSPFNKIVVQWHETKLNFIGVRDNITLKEQFFGDHDLASLFNVPKIFPLRTVDECIDAASKLDCNAEGYVVVDSAFHRVKIKSPVYVSLHHMKNNGVLSYERGVEIVKSNELDEVLQYFPEFKEHLEKIRDDYNKMVADIESCWIKFLEEEDAGKFSSRKDQALYITANFKKYSGVGFALLDKKYDSVKDWASACSNKNIVKYLGYKE